MARSIFTLTIIQDGENIAIHAAHTGEKSTAFDAGMALVESLTGADSIEEACLSTHTSGPAWVQ